MYTPGICQSCAYSYRKTDLECRKAWNKICDEADEVYAEQTAQFGVTTDKLHEMLNGYYGSCRHY